MHHALFIIHHALWMTHDWLFITHYSLVIVHYALCITHHASCIMHHASCIMHSSLFNIHHALFNMHDSSVNIQYSFFILHSSKSLTHSSSCALNTEWRSITGCLIVTGHFPQKSLMIRCSFAENHLQLKASCGSSPPLYAPRLHPISPWSIPEKSVPKTHIHRVFTILYALCIVLYPQSQQKSH